MPKLGMEENVPIEHGMVSRAIERAQKQVEAQNFSVRKHLLEYDDVMNKQRENTYALRRQILEGKILLEDEEGQQEELGTRDYLLTLAEDVLDSVVGTHAPRDADFEQWDLEALKPKVRTCSRWTSRPGFPTGLRTRFARGEAAHSRVVPGERSTVGATSGRVRRDIMLQIVDSQWKDHLYSLDHLKGHRPARIATEGPAHRIQAGELRPLQAMKERVDERSSATVVAAPGVDRRRTAGRAPARRPAASAPHPERSGNGHRAGLAFWRAEASAVAGWPRRRPGPQTAGARGRR
jgi:preprotein translocase subunit SecA